MNLPARGPPSPLCHVTGRLRLRSPLWTSRIGAGAPRSWQPTIRSGQTPTQPSLRYLRSALQHHRRPTTDDRVDEPTRLTTSSTANSTLHVRDNDDDVPSHHPVARKARSARKYHQNRKPWRQLSKRSMRRFAQINTWTTFARRVCIPVISLWRRQLCFFSVIAHLAVLELRCAATKGFRDAERVNNANNSRCRFLGPSE